MPDHHNDKYWLLPWLLRKHKQLLQIYLIDLLQVLIVKIRNSDDLRQRMIVSAIVIRCLVHDIVSARVVIINIDIIY